MDLEKEVLLIKTRAYLGAARVPLESLRFSSIGSRMPNEDCEKRLLEIFGVNQGCRATVPRSTARTGPSSPVRQASLGGSQKVLQ
jgi:hypothetical protein